MAPLEIVVYGASGFGRQVMFWLEDAAAGRDDWRVAGFLDDDPAAHGDVRTGHPVLGGGEWIEGRGGGAPVAVVLGIAVPAVKERLAARASGAGARLLTVIHPTAVLSRHATVGEGSVVGPFNVLSTDVVVGRCATVNTACTLGHDVTVGDFAALLPGCNLSGHVDIGPGATIGTNAAVVQHVSVGAGATLGAGSTALGDVPAGATAVGTPARVLER
jgi:sugar O-acyltransferase (sialic acid O-acetyltransferase NeuD family)